MSGTRPERRHMVRSSGRRWSQADLRGLRWWHGRTRPGGDGVAMYRMGGQRFHALFGRWRVDVMDPPADARGWRRWLRWVKRTLALLVLGVLLPACRTGTEVTYNPATHEVRFSRGMLGGPVEFDVELADGSKLHWKSDVNYDAYQALGEARIGQVDRLLGLVEQLAPVAGGAP